MLPREISSFAEQFFPAAKSRECELWCRRSAHPERVAELHERLRAYEAQAAPPLKPGPMPKGFRGPPVWGVFERVEAPGSDG
jgi:hypothetical protein